MNHYIEGVEADSEGRAWGEHDYDRKDTGAFVSNKATLASAVYYLLHGDSIIEALSIPCQRDAHRVKNCKLPHSASGPEPAIIIEY